MAQEESAPMQAQPNAASATDAPPQNPILPMSPAALRATTWAMLDELATMLRWTRDQVLELRDSSTVGLAEGYDARAHIGYILDRVEALDCLGWREAIQTEADLDKIAQEYHAARRREDEQEGENR